jgi:hypothetical protein
MPISMLNRTKKVIIFLIMLLLTIFIDLIYLNSLNKNLKMPMKNFKHFMSSKKWKIIHRKMMLIEFDQFKANYSIELKNFLNIFLNKSQI